MGGMKDTLGDDLFSYVPPITAAEPKGPAYVPARDRKRLGAQAQRIIEVVKDGQWHTLSELSAKVSAPEPSVSAQLRHIRAAGHTVEREHVGNGLHKYRVVVAQEGKGTDG